MKAEGHTKDPQGRPGVAIAFPSLYGQSTPNRLIIDPDTSMVLAFLNAGVPSRSTSTEVVLEAGWTDSEPVAPQLSRECSCPATDAGALWPGMLASLARRLFNGQDMGFW